MTGKKLVKENSMFVRKWEIIEHMPRQVASAERDAGTFVGADFLLFVL